MREDQRVVFVLSLVVFLVLLGITLLTPALPFYAQALGATELMVGILIAAFAIARVPLNIPAGILGDRWGQKRVMGYGLVAIAVSSFLAGLAFNYWVLLAVRVAEGAGSAMYVTSSSAMMARVVPEDRRGRYMGYFVAALLMGAVLGPAVGGYVALLFGLRAPFFFYALIAAAAFVLVRVYLPQETVAPQGRAVRLGEIGGVLRSPSFLLVNVGVLGAFFVRGGFNATIFPLWGEAKFGLGTGIIGALLTLAALAGLATLLPAGRYADRRGRKAPFVASLLLTALVLPFLFRADSLVTLTLMMTLYGLAIGLHGPLDAWIVDLAPRERLGTVMGVYRTIGDMGWVLGPLVLTAVSEVTGPVAQHPDNPWPFVVAALWLAVTGLLLLRARDPVAKARVRLPLLGDGGP